jgi:alpha-beta hydrolase superfamily lysophospholipase
MRTALFNSVKWFAIGAASLAAVLLAARAVHVRSGPPLMPWHTHVPAELGVQALDNGDWAALLAAEARIFATLDDEVTRKLPHDAQVAVNRYHAHSPMHAANFAQDWNRSYLLEPAGAPQGVVVLLHGLTDSPYSLRHVAQRYRERGFVAIGPRLPGHGTVPGGLTAARWQDWMAATRLALREARARVPAPAPLHVVGFSNGGALALKHALDAIEDPRLPRADHLILLTPMIGVTRYARFAGLAGLPALLPPFDRAAWLNVVPEFNPFKYNSFPVNAARQTYLATDALQAQMQRLAEAGQLASLPPLLTFQSVVDATVSAPEILGAVYARLPDNGSEVVFFDINRRAHTVPMMQSAAVAALDELTPKQPQAFRFTAIANAGADSAEVVERSIAPGQLGSRSRPLNLRFPDDVFSLSHIAMPMPMDDALYGLVPDATRNEFGIHLGALSVRGERGVLLVDQEHLTRLSANPFFPYLIERIDEAIRRDARGQGRQR